MLERQAYIPPIPDQLRQKYEAALGQVLRWKNGNLADNISETDMEHVTRMFFILEDLKNRSPTLSSDVDIPTVEHMIYIHDAGEIIVGDLVHNRDDYNLVRNKWKRREKRAFVLLTLFCIKDENTRTQARQLYERFTTVQEFQQEASDKEALLAEFIDKDQGLRFGYQHAFNGKGMNRQTREMHMNHAIGLVQKPTNALLKLVSTPTQEDLKNFLKDEIMRFSTYGYQREAAYYLKNFDAYFR